MVQTRAQKKRDLAQQSINSKIASTFVKSFIHERLIHFCIWKPSEKTWTLWACMFAYIINISVAYFAWTVLQNIVHHNVSTSADTHLYTIAALIHANFFDISMNMLNELFEYDLQLYIILSFVRIYFRFTLSALSSFLYCFFLMSRRKCKHVFLIMDIYFCS